jgi:ppGpp synthetase/RelA/SpoT-type nucleotidyltranferase
MGNENKNLTEQEKSMSIIDRFLEDYKARMDRYERVAQLCAIQCESGLRRNGLRALVTYRAKRLDSLLEKVTIRHAEKNYQTLDEIYDDIVDLAGVRIALYFPGDRTEVDALVRSHFLVEKVKNFPEDIDYSYPYPKRFSGYSARHYRIRLRPSSLAHEDQHLAELLVELQVGSVLMHSWAEVEHDLVYKNRLGHLSYDEYAILDELNGLMHAGEVALERLQEAVKRRIQTESQPFSNHYELAAYLYDYLRQTTPHGTEPFIGRADILFRFLQILGLDTVKSLEPFLGKCNPRMQSKPITEQIVDIILAQNEEFYQAYNRARQEVSRIDPFGAPHEAVSYFSDKRGLGFFMRQWIAMETILSEIVGNVLLSSDNFSTSLQKARNGLDDESLAELEHVHRLRDQILYGDSWPSEEELTRAGKFLQKLLQNLSHHSPDVEEILRKYLPPAEPQ